MLYFEDVEVGSARTSGEFELTEREVIDFARAWDPQPFHVDPQAAARSPFGGFTASACHVFCVGAKLLSEMEPLAVVAAARHELDLLRPARPGDRLSMTVTCTEPPVGEQARPRHGAVRVRAPDGRRLHDRPAELDDRARP
jgi:acyl dehydratase